MTIGKAGGWNLVKKYTNDPIMGSKVGIIYVLKLEHILSGKSCFKYGITSSSIKQRYTGKDYREWNITTLAEFKTTNLFTALIEDKISRSVEFAFPPFEVFFGGYTETLPIDFDITILTDFIKTEITNIKELNANKSNQENN